MQCDRVCTYDNLKVTVWFDCHSMASILSLALLVKERQVYFDLAAGNVFLVIKEDGTMMRFIEQGLEIYVHNIKHNNDISHNPPNAYNDIVPVMINHNLMSTADTSLVLYTEREVAQAHLGWEQMNIVGPPTQKDHKDMIANNTLHNSSVMIADIHWAYNMFEPAVPALQWKSKPRKPDPVPNTSTDAVQQYL